MPGKGQIPTSQAQRGQEQVAVRSQPRGRAALGRGGEGSRRNSSATPACPARPRRAGQRLARRRRPASRSKEGREEGRKGGRRRRVGGWGRREGAGGVTACPSGARRPRRGPSLGVQARSRAPWGRPSLRRGRVRPSGSRRAASAPVSSLRRPLGTGGEPGARRRRRRPWAGGSAPPPRRGLSPAAPRRASARPGASRARPPRVPGAGGKGIREQGGGVPPHRRERTERSGAGAGRVRCGSLALRENTQAFTAGG